MTVSREYINFLRGKIQVAPTSGFDVRPADIHPSLKPHQRDAVIWALKGGKRALFEKFGLGKTAQELEWCRLVAAHTGGQTLIILPLGVRQEFTRDAVQLLGMEAPAYVRNMAEIRAQTAPILMTNYERVRDGDIDPTYFDGVALDEASVLRSYGSKTFQTFMPLFQGVPFKLVATATPAPNKYKELIHYAGFLDVMDTGQALTRFFQRDSTKRSASGGLLRSAMARPGCSPPKRSFRARGATSSAIATGPSLWAWIMSSTTSSRQSTASTAFCKPNRLSLTSSAWRVSNRF